MLYYVIYKYNVYVYIYIYVHIFNILSPWSPTLRLQFSPRSSPRRARRCIQGKNGTEKTPRTWEICGNLWKSMEIPWEICEIWENHQRFPGFCSFTKVLHDFSHQNMGRVLQFLQPRSWFLFGLVDWFWMSWFSQDIPKIRYDPNDRCSSSSIHFGRPVRAGF